MKNKFDFKNAEDFRRAERLSYDGSLDVSDFPPPEYKYFSELCKVYHAYRFEVLSQEEAEHRKKSLLIDYRKYLENFENTVQVYKKYQNNIRTVGMNASRIEKSHNTAEIALLACEALGAVMGEETFYGRQKKKIIS